jgi:hypothetical protein
LVVAAHRKKEIHMSKNIPTVVGLGRLVEFVIRDPHGQRLRVTPTDERWLAWKPDTRDLVVLRPGRGQQLSIDSRAAKRHAQFHGAAPQKARRMELPTPQGKLKTLGLIESVTYSADEIHSPLKKSHHWVHQFGDRGERGHGSLTATQVNSFPARLFPELVVDTAGNYVVCRRTGNRYAVRDWIIG